MTDLELILLVLAVFYAAETFVWVCPGSIAFVSHGFGGRFRAGSLDTTATVRNASGGLLWGSFFPWGVLYLARPNPMSPGVDGALGYTAQHPTRDARPTDGGRLVGWNEATSAAADGRKVIVAGEPFLATESPAVAGYAAGELRRLADLKEHKRAAAIEALAAAAFDETALGAELARVRTAFRFMRLTCTLLFVWLFVALPAMNIRGMLDQFGDWLIGYGCILILHLATFFVAHRRLYPTARGKRWGRLLTMVISPADAARSYAILQRDVPLGFHPLTVAASLCDRSTLSALGRRTLLDMNTPRAPVCTATDPRAAAIEQSFRELSHTAAEKLLKRHEIDVGRLLAPPPRDENAACYCPRCDEQWLQSLELCPSCGVGVKAYDQAMPA